MEKAAIYARYSSDKQSGESIKTQVDKCREYCDREGIVVVQEFIDEAKSGTTEDGRVEYARMLAMASKGMFDTIIAYKYDRIGRSFVDTVRSIYELEHYHGIKVFSATEPNDPLVRNILLSVAEDFSRQLAARMYDTMTSNAGQGFHCGGTAPYGYVGIESPDATGRTDRKGQPIKHVVFDPDPIQAVIVQRIFRDYAEGISMKKVAHALNDDGIVSPGGGTWDLSAVRYILYNEAYRGWRIWNKTKKVRKPDGKKTYRHRPRSEWVIVKDAHPAIIDDELWDATDTMLKRMKRHRAHKSKKGGERTAFSEYLLTGVVKCEVCGANYIVHAGRGRNAGRHAYYRCGYHQRRGNSVCSNNTPVKKDRLEGAVLDLLQDEILTKKTVELLAEDVRKAWKAQPTGSSDLKRTEKDLRAVEREIVNLVQAIKTAGISDSLSAELDRCERRKAELTHQHKELDQTKPESDRLPTDAEIRSALKGFRCLLESGTPQERRTVIEENIEQIVVRPSGDVLLQVNPNGLLPNRPFDWCREPDSNRHGL